METISRDELKARLDRGDDFRLMMVLKEDLYRAKHIPGSIDIRPIDRLPAMLRSEEDIVLYCAGVPCYASRLGCRVLCERGYEHVRRYPGRIFEWEEAGYPLEGRAVGKPWPRAPEIAA